MYQLISSGAVLGTFNTKEEALSLQREKLENGTKTIKKILFWNSKRSFVYRAYNYKNAFKRVRKDFPTPVYIKYVGYQIGLIGEIKKWIKV